MEANRRMMYGGERTEYQGLDGYASAPRRSPWQQGGKNPTETDQAYVNRLTPFLQNLTDTLDPKTLSVVASEYNSAVERLNDGQQTHEQLRERIENRSTGYGVGIMGATPQVTQFAPNTTGMPTSGIEIAAMLRQREAERRG
jgi:hypothetical protein